MTPSVPRLHAVTNQRIVTSADLAQRTALLARGEDVAVHCRHAPTTRAALGAIESLHSGAATTGTLIIVNDRVDTAIASAAHGVHLPADGMPVAAARGLLGPDRIVGRSTHTPDEVARALDEGSDYVFFGPVWNTPSHPDRAAVGVGALRAACRHDIAVVAVGGVTSARASELIEAGAYGAAAISALWDAPDPGLAMDAFLLSFGR